MLLGLSSFSYHLSTGLYKFRPVKTEPLGLQDLLAKTAQLQLRGFYLDVPDLLESRDYTYLTGLRTRIEELQLYLELGTGGTDPDQLEDLIRVAHMLGSSVLRTFLGIDRSQGERHRHNYLEKATQNLKKVAATAERYKLKIGVENRGDLNCREILDLISSVGSPWVGICFDTGNPLATVEDPIKVAKAFAPHVCTVHLKDYRVLRTEAGVVLVGCALGEGVLDLPEILRLLSKSNPDLHLNIETPLSKVPVPCIKQEFLEQFPGLTALDLAALLRLAETGQLEGYPDPLAGEEKEALAYEEEMVCRSVDYARQVLGSASLDLGL